MSKQANRKVSEGGWRYVRAYRTVKVGNVLSYEPHPPPRTVSAGRVLAHNHVRHTIDMTSGRNGFRAWTWPKEGKPRSFVRCACGWSGLPHYARREHARSYRCESERVIAAFKE